MPQIQMNSGRPMSLEDRYSQVLKNAEKSGKEYMEKLFGKVRVHSASLYYYGTSSIINSGLPVEEWQNIDNSTRGQVLAYNEIQNMIRTIERHEELQQQIRRDIASSK